MRALPRHPLLPLLLFACLGVPVRAQELLHTLDQPQPAPVGGFSEAVAGVPDVDGDGHGDLLVGAPSPLWASTHPPIVYLYSGADGTLLYEILAPSGQHDGSFGSSVSGVPDLDGDGRGDLLVGARAEGGYGRAYVFSGATGVLLRTLEVPVPGESGLLGWSTAGVEDVDGDGRGDVLIGAPSSGAGSRVGRAYLFSGATGALLLTLAPPGGEPGEWFGFSVSGVPDADGDGRADLLVGSRYANTAGLSQSGRAYLFSSADGMPLHTLTSPDPELGGLFGWSVAGVPDVDGDGRGDLLVGALGEAVGSDFAAGRAYLFSGATGARLRTLRSPHATPSGIFGHAVAAVEDVDGDGRGDLFIGAPGENPNGSGIDEGRAYCLSGADGEVLFEVTTPNPNTIYDNEFGTAMSAVPDLNGDGFSDLIVGEASLTTLENRAYVFSGAPVRFALSPERVDFGGVDIGLTSPPEPITVTNVSAVPVTLTAIEIGGGDAGVFAVTSAPSLPHVLPPGGSVEVEVVFAPVETGRREAALVVEGNGARLSVELAGAGTVPGPFVVTALGGSDGVCDAHCTFGEAFALASLATDRDTILFAPAIDGHTYIVHDWVIPGDLRIDTGGKQIGFSGDGFTHVFLIPSSATVELVGVTILNAKLDWGGAIQNDGYLTLENSTVRDGGGLSNRGRLALVRSAVHQTDGIYNEGTLTVAYSTVSGNYNGAVSGSRGRVSVLRSTIVNNEDGGIRAGEGLVTGSVVAGHGADCIGDFDSGGHNVFVSTGGCPIGATDAAVGPSEVFTRVLHPGLADNGGPTLTHALHDREDNLALDLGGVCGPTDQRGFPAPLDGPDPDAMPSCDAGAVEQGTAAVAIALTPLSPPVVIPEDGGGFRFVVAVANGTAAPQTLDAWTEATYPDGSVRRAMGPVTVVLGPGEGVARTLKQRVPRALPPGAYTYTGYVGTYPDAPLASAAFSGTKEGAPSPEARSSPEAAWSEEGWSAVYDGSERPVVPGDVWAASAPAARGAPPASSASILPSSLALHAPRPNPFSSRTALGYDLPEASPVRLVVYDVLGREATVLVSGEVAPGRHEAVLDGTRLPAGTYLVRLEAGGLVQTRRVTLVR